MPYKPLAPCSYPGCRGRATVRGRCALHPRPAPVRTYAPRKGSTERGYGYAWQKLRAEYLRLHPNCVACGNAATDVDHILPLTKGGASTSDNLQSLCHSCHSRKTRLVDYPKTKWYR